MARSADRTYYEILGVSPDASLEEIQSAHRQLARQVHPDKGGSAALFQLITDAKSTLSDPVKRRMYDATLNDNRNHGTTRPASDKGWRASDPRASSEYSRSTSKQINTVAERPAECLLGVGLLMLLLLPPASAGLGVFATILGGVALIGKVRLRKELSHGAVHPGDPLAALSGAPLLRAELARGVPAIMAVLGTVFIYALGLKQRRRRR